MKKKILIIFGAGGLGKEVLELSRWVNETERRWDDIMFRDDIQDEGNILGAGNYHSDKVRQIASENDAEYVIALGEPHSKEKTYELLLSEEASFATLIAPDAQVSLHAKLGCGVIVKKGSIIQANATIMDNTTLQSYVAIGHDAVVGRHCQISTFSVVGGKTIIGDQVYISMNCSIRDSIKIENEVIVSAGSAVLRDVPERVTVMGNPARVISRNGEEKRVFS